ncbi:MAG: glycosyltransferase family 2 protein [archaeon]
MKVLISIPAFNEARTIGRVLDDIHTVMKKSKYKYNVLVVDDGSRDATYKIAMDHGAKVFRHPRNCGLAEAFRTEMKLFIESDCDVFVHTDADGQYLSSEIPKLLKEIENGYDLVLGSRFKGKIEHMPLLKRMGNIAFSKVLTHITQTPISDGQTGFRAFTKEVAKKVQITSTFTYTQEQIIRTVKNKFHIKEVPAYFARRGGKSRLMKGPFDYAIKAWINIFRIYRDYEPLKFFGLFGGTFFALGSFVILWLLFLFFTTGTIGHLPSLLLAILLITVGIQILLFGFLADMHRK